MGFYCTDIFTGKELCTDLLIKSGNCSSSHGGKNLDNYFATLRSIWEELNHYEIYKPKCQTDAMTYKEKIERGKLFEFLVALNDEFELVCINILSRGQLPSLNEAYALAQGEESKKNVMDQYASRPPKRSALVSTPFQKEGKSSFKKPFRPNH